MGNGFHKLQIALVMTIIDLAIIMPAPEEPENLVRAQNKADDAWAIMGTWVPNLPSGSR